MVLAAQNDEKKKIVANWECRKFPSETMWVLTTNHTVVEGDDTAGSLTPMLIYTHQRQKKNNINHVFFPQK